MRTAICYYSQHHGNTRKVLEAIAQGTSIDLIDVTAPTTVDLAPYDVIGFASGIYAGRFHDSVITFAQQHLPEGKHVFFVYTYGIRQNRYTKAIAKAVAAKHANNLGAFGCNGFNTFGPFKLVGGIAKGRPNADDLENAKAFYRSLCQSLGELP